MLKIFTSTLLSFLSWIMLGEKLSWAIFLATGIVTSGLLLSTKTEIKQGYIRKKVQTSN